MSTKTTAPKKTTIPPEVPNFKFERHAAATDRVVSARTPPVKQEAVIEFEPLKPDFIDQLLRGLLDRASENVTEDDLIKIIHSRNNVVDYLRHIGELTEVIGCQVNGDSSAGSFSDGSNLATLLFMLSTYAKQGEAYASLGDHAEDMPIRRFHQRTGRAPTDPLSVYRAMPE